MKKIKTRILPITQLGNPILRRSLKRVPRDRLAKLAPVIRDMIATMKKAQGVGIAANQVGIDQRLFIVAPQPSVRYPRSPSWPPLAMVNPKLLRASSSEEIGWEGCLSIPGIRARVPRRRWVEVEFTTSDGEARRAKLSGFVARIFQHEFDHINGHVYLDRVRDPRTFMTESEYRRLFR
ncbi:MAG TPA: peptide deformylase [Elusimicrobiota bacterium]|nr:peptide deformylase [Elusimicrobiota bacterium]